MPSTPTNGDCPVQLKRYDARPASMSAITTRCQQPLGEPAPLGIRSARFQQRPDHLRGLASPDGVEHRGQGRGLGYATLLGRGGQQAGARPTLSAPAAAAISSHDAGTRREPSYIHASRSLMARSGRSTRLIAGV